MNLIGRRVGPSPAEGLCTPRAGSPQRPQAGEGVARLRRARFERVNKLASLVLSPFASLGMTMLFDFCTAWGPFRKSGAGAAEPDRKSS
jgi:hypothetical protein